MHVAHGGGFGVGAILLDLFSGEFRPGVEVVGIDGINPSGEDRGVKGCVVEGNAVAEVGYDGSVGG
jgi:hypothetical protein